ncbi:MAG: glutamate 5-kinase [Myxococcales bacterium]|nr:glutamate 5-kinase [Myxococcales bacterium]
MTSAERRSLESAKRIVVKIGSRSLIGEKERFEEIAAQIASLVAMGKEVLLVSSGAVAAGRKRLGIAERPKQLALLQAVAAAGQSALMRSYELAFEPHGLRAAQILLTHADLAARERYLNARNALEALLELGVVPIINENDTVSVDELRFGDNDQLAAMVAALASADLLVLLTDVEGVLDADGKRIPLVSDVDAVLELVRPPTDDVGLGGMASKIEAARRATMSGVPVIIGDARDPELLSKLVRGEDCGTLFLPHGSPLASKKHWIAYTLKPKGTIVVDAGAARAVCEGNASLLPGGVVGVRGDFDVGDPVAIVDPEQREIARGLSRFPMNEVARMAGKKPKNGKGKSTAVVHRDELVVLAPKPAVE